MRKKFLSAFMLGALTLAATSTFVSCKDYDGDVADVKNDVNSLQDLVKKLQSQIDAANNDHATKAALQTAQSTLQAAIDTKADKTAVEKAIAEAQGALQAAINLKADATALEQLKKDFDAYKTTVAETYVTIGRYEAALEAQKAVDDAQDAVDAATKAEVEKLLAEVKSIKETEQDVENRLQGVESSLKELGAKLGIVAQALASDLRSLVYMPYLYVGGIETIEYPFLNVDYMKLTGEEKDEEPWVRDYDKQEIQILDNYDYTVDDKNKGQTTPLVAQVDYHSNPSFANVAYSDIIGYNVREALVSKGATPAKMPKVTSPETWYAAADAPKVFNHAANGVLSAGILLDNSADTKKWLKGETTGDFIVALQAKTKTGIEKKDSIITSDYAMLLPEEVQIEGLAFNKPGVPGSNVIQEETGCPKTTHKHLWETAKQALQHNDKPAFNVYCFSEGFNLQDSLEIHVKNLIKDKFATKNGITDTIQFKDAAMAKLGLTYEFKKVNYTSGVNKTKDSNYCTLDPNTGAFKPMDVNPADGTTADHQGESAAHRQPLVQVLVYQNGTVILDGYILINITSTPENMKYKDIVIDNYAKVTYDWKVCGTDTLNKAMRAENGNTWYQFDSYVLDNNIFTEKKISKTNFEKTYNPDYVLPHQMNEKNNNGYEEHRLKVFTYDAANKVYNEVTTHGEIWLNIDKTGTTNYTFNWLITAAQLEALMHHETTKDLTVYFRFVANSKAEEYRYVYVKLDATVNRHQYDLTWGEKIDERWFAKSGDEKGYEAIVFDAMAPRDGKSIIENDGKSGNEDQWWSEIGNSLVTEKVKIKNEDLNEYQVLTGYQDARFYFVPGTYTVEGSKYTVTTRQVLKDAKKDKAYAWMDSVYCKYIEDAKSVKEFKHHPYAELDNYINNCAINYQEGAFKNIKLYAIETKDFAKTDDANKYTEIAELIPETGRIILKNNAITQDLLNATDYEANHANIMKQLRAEVGVVYTDNKCGVARKLIDDKFFVSWQRPINVYPVDGAKVTDANTNENKVNIFDYLKLTDWRNVEIAGENTWFMSYYRVNSVTIHLDEITTNMNGGTLETTKLAEVTTKVNFLVNGIKNKAVPVTEFYTDQYKNNWNKAGTTGNGRLVKDMTDHPAKYGQLVYENNGGNVTEFDVLVPVTVGYTWGSQTVKVKIHVNSTLGHE